MDSRLTLLFASKRRRGNLRDLLRMGRYPCQKLGVKRCASGGPLCGELACRSHRDGQLLLEDGKHCWRAAARRGAAFKLAAGMGLLSPMEGADGLL